MKQDLFVSVIAPVRNGEKKIGVALEKIFQQLSTLFHHFEIIVIDDGSTDRTFEELQSLLTRKNSIRVLRLGHEQGVDRLASLGLQTAIGDVVVILDPLSDPAEMIPVLIEKSRQVPGVHYGIDLSQKRRWFREKLASLFEWYCRKFLNIDVQRQSSILRVFDRTAMNSFLRLRQRTRLLKFATAHLGVPVHSLTYRSTQPSTLIEDRQGLFESLNTATDLLVSSSRHPLRWVSRLGVLAAGFNILYVFYVIGVYFFKNKVAEGWVTLSMQNAVMFLFLFVVLTVLCEYVGNQSVEAKSSAEIPLLSETSSSVMIDPTIGNNVDERVTALGPRITDN